MKALRLLEQPAAAVDAVAAAETELARVRAEIEQAKAEAQQLGQAWLTAATQDAAEAIERQRLESERVAKRDEQQIPQLEARVTAAKAEKQRHGVARHRAAIAAFVPELVAAVEAAAAMQVQAIQLREAAIAELGEGAVQREIPVVGFLGLLLPDLVRDWSRSLQRMFAPAAAATPRPVASRPSPKAAAAKPVISPPPPRPARPPRRDPPPEHPDQVVVTMLRANVQLGDGSLSVVGDELTLMRDDARQLLLSGAADYVKEAGNG
jgi:hypothetical protein